jgi:hypothetical protein
MQDVPVPPTPPVPDVVVPDVIMPDVGPMLMTGDDIAKIVIASLLGLSVITWIIARGPIGMAIGAAIRKLTGVDQVAALPGELESMRAELETLRRQVGEMAERQDFAERLLAQVRRERLPNPTDVAS